MLAKLKKVFMKLLLKAFKLSETWNGFADVAEGAISQMKSRSRE